jgi:anti-sigma regulatory factor (Ser/Thr protein kinase)
MKPFSPCEGEYRVVVREAIDLFTARWTAQRIAGSIGFPSLARQEIAIVVSELGTNILKYGHRGHIAMRSIEETILGRGIEIVAEDEGPLLADLDMALRDGHCERGPIDPIDQPRRGGIGAGLGAVVRFSDTFEYIPAMPRKAFRVVRYLRRPTRRATSQGEP